MDESFPMKRYSIFVIVLIAFFATTATAERLAIVAPVANIRSGPDTKSDILWKVEKYYPIFVVKKSGSWYQFKDFEEDSGWVHKSLVGKVKAVITNKDLCNIRSKVLKRKDRWLNVEHADGDKGWIHDSLVW